MPSLSFIDFLDHYGRQNPPSMRYHDGDDFSKWQKRFREKLKSLRGPVPQRVKLKTNVLESVDCSTHTRHHLEIAVTEFTTLPAYLLIPNDIAPDEKRPALVATHGHVDFGYQTVAGFDNPVTDNDPREAYGLRAVEAGFVVICPAWWGWTGRDGHFDLTKGRDRCNVIQMAASMYGLNVLDLHIQDGQAAVDVLASRPEVDSEKIGCLGNSYGGRTAMWLTVFDPRIRACVASGCANHFRERSLKLSSCGIQFFHGLLHYGDVPEIFSLIAPRALQIMTGDADPLHNNEDRDRIVSTVQKAYQHMNGGDKFDFTRHPQGHLLKWELAEPFLKQHLA